MARAGPWEAFSLQFLQGASPDCGILMFGKHQVEGRSEGAQATRLS